MTTHAKRIALARARHAMLGMGTIERKIEGKTIPAYDLTMVRRLEPGKAPSTRPRTSGYDQSLRLVPGKAIVGNARRCLVIG